MNKIFLRFCSRKKLEYLFFKTEMDILKQHCEEMGEDFEMVKKDYIKEYWTPMIGSLSRKDLYNYIEYNQLLRKVYSLIPAVNEVKKKIADNL